MIRRQLVKPVSKQTCQEAGQSMSAPQSMSAWTLCDSLPNVGGEFNYSCLQMSFYEAGDVG